MKYLYYFYFFVLKDGLFFNMMIFLFLVLSLYEKKKSGMF